MYFERFVYFLFDNIFQVSGNSSSNRHTQKMTEDVYGISVLLLTEKEYISNMKFLPSPQQNKFTLPCWTVFKLKQVLEILQQLKWFYHLSVKQMITDTRSVLSQVNGSHHWALKNKTTTTKKALLPFPQAQRVKKQKHRSQMNGLPHPPTSDASF